MIVLYVCLSIIILTAAEELIEKPRLVELARDNDLGDFMKEIRTSTLSIDIQNENGATALHWACHHGNLEMVDTLVTSGADLNLPNNVGYTPLHHSVMGQHTAVAIYLIRAGAEVNAKTLDASSTALHYAAWKGMLEVVEELVNAGADMIATDAHGHRAISIASGSGHRAVREFLGRRSGVSL
tara:strand:+ start:23 stop:571 length:549 start_codon:yes stop_codon:yes gene_type:complete